MKENSDSQKWQFGNSDDKPQQPAKPNGSATDSSNSWVFSQPAQATVPASTIVPNPPVPPAQPPVLKQRPSLNAIVFGSKGRFTKNLKFIFLLAVIMVALGAAVHFLCTELQFNMPGFVTALVAGAVAGLVLLHRNQNGEIREKLAFVVATVAGIYMYSTHGGQISGGYAFAWTFLGVGALCAMIVGNPKPNLFVWLAEVAPAVLLFLAFERLGGAISGFGEKDIIWGDVASVRYLEAGKMFLWFCLFQFFANNVVFAQLREAATSKLKQWTFCAVPVAIVALVACVFLNPFKLPVFDAMKSNLIAFSQPVKAGADVFDSNGKKIGVATKTPRSSALLSTSIPGYLATAYDFSYNGKMDSAKITFEYDAGLGRISDNFQPRIYYFNEVNGTLEELPNQTIISDSGKGWSSVTATTAHFSTYILLNSVEYNKEWYNQVAIRKPPKTMTINPKFDVVFVIDESGSMQQNDPAYLRVDAAKQFVNAMAAESSNNRAAIYGFENSARLISHLTELSQKDEVINLLNSIHSGGGTNIHSGLAAAMQEIQSDSRSVPIIILLTDGQDNSNISHYQDIIKTANAIGTTIYTIGLGQVDEKLLREIANQTGGVYYYATSAELLKGIFTTVQKDEDGYFKDSNGDKISDYYAKLLTEGKLKLSTGSTYLNEKGIDWVNCPADLDGDGLLNGEEIVVTDKQVNDTLIHVHVKMISDPTEKDTDGDGIIDALSEEYTKPILGKYEIGGIFLTYNGCKYQVVLPDNYNKNGTWWLADNQISSGSDRGHNDNITYGGWQQVGQVSGSCFDGAQFMLDLSVDAINEINDKLPLNLSLGANNELLVDLDIDEFITDAIAKIRLTGVYASAYVGYETTVGIVKLVVIPAKNYVKNSYKIHISFQKRGDERRAIIRTGLLANKEERIDSELRKRLPSGWQLTCSLNDMLENAPLSNYIVPFEDGTCLLRPIIHEQDYAMYNYKFINGKTQYVTAKRSISLLPLTLDDKASMLVQKLATSAGYNFKSGELIYDNITAPGLTPAGPTPPPSLPRQSTVLDAQSSTPSPQPNSTPPPVAPK
ncbi:MAG: VWA domain-containing protein [Candidatus Symbiothrix sp.]|jgi:uncharacterized protein YegL|nr:VWA domain-containing protein [Candidatus Symbiothrix sp.]